MSAGILLLAHNGIAAALIAAAKHVYCGSLPLDNIQALDIPTEMTKEQICQEIIKHGNALENGKGLLILTDLVNATPCQTAEAFNPDYPVQIVTGVNLPMLLKVITYAGEELPLLAEKAVEGGCQGIEIMSHRT